MKSVTICFFINAGTSSDANSGDDVSSVTDPGQQEFDPKGRLKFMRPTAEHQSRHRFGEPRPEMNALHETPIIGQFQKIGAAGPGLIADKDRIVVVDCQKFSGSSRFPQELTKDWMQGGDNAVLVQPWLVGATSIFVRRQTALDESGKYSSSIEEFLVSSCCMPERHVISANWVNMLAGVYDANPSIPEPKILLWLSNRRGVPVVENDASMYLQLIAKMSGPVCVHDLIQSDLSNFSSLMTNNEFSTVSGSNLASRNGFEGLVLVMMTMYAVVRYVRVVERIR